MDVISQLASSLGRRDEVPNRELAAAIAKRKDKKAISELVGLLKGKNKDHRSDSIKVLYEAGEILPSLLSPHAAEFLELLDTRDNRRQWGLMTALSAVTKETPDLIFKSLPRILDIAEKGSVITKDRAVVILVKLGSLKQYGDKVFPLLLEQLSVSLPNQLPMYAENSLSLITRENKQAFIKVLESRLGDMEKESKKKRVEKVIAKAAKL